MPSLDFKGKAFVYAHHLTVPFRELVPDAKKSCLPKSTAPALDGNLIIHGDNLHALKALLPLYAGKVDCVFIDPPYNTGNEGWCYNDNVRSPVAKEWLKKASPVDKEDLERHDKWACMMWPRLKLLHELLSPTGSIWITLDDNEAHRGKILLDEIFGEQNFLANVVWEKADSPRMDADYFSSRHDHLLVYARNLDDVTFQRLGIGIGDELPEHYDKEDSDGRKFYLKPLRAMGGQGETREARPNLFFAMKSPDGTDIFPKLQDGSDGAWRWGREKVKREQNRIEWKKGSNGWTPYFRIYADTHDGRPPETIFYNTSVGSSRTAKAQIKEIFQDGSADFDTPKPVGLLSHILAIATHPDSLVLDSFGGSGTTAHAVLAQNKKDGGKRRFILVECENYADTLTAERVRRVIRGYPFTGTKRTELMREPLNWTKLKKADALVEKAESIKQLEGADYDEVKITVEAGELVVTGEMTIKDKAPGIPGAFTYCTLGAEMSLEGLLTGKDLPAFEALAKYVFYTATGRTLATVVKQPTKGGDGLIGEVEHYRVHLIYQPDQAWLRSEAAVLTETKVEAIVAGRPAGQRSLVFAAAKYLSQKDLTGRGVEFCQLPYAIHRILGESATPRA